MGKRILKTGKPYVTFIQDYAFITAAMSADNSIYNWIMNNAIQIYYIPQNHGYNLTYFYLGNESNPINNIPLFEHQIIKMDFLKKSSLSLIEFTKLMIDSGYYVTNTLNEYYLKTRKAYMNYDFEHGILIYGYDDENQQIYTAGFDSTGSFRQHEISFDIYNEAFDNTKRNSRISCFRRNALTYDIDIVLIKHLLEEFLKSSNTSNCYRIIQNPLSNCLWGIEAFYKLQYSRDMRYYYMLYEYINLWQKRVKCLDLNMHENELKELANKAKTIMNMVIKENIKEKSTDSVRIKLNELLQELEDTLKVLYDDISIKVKANNYFSI